MPRPSTRIVETVARREECDPLDLPPLHDAVDADALDQVAGDAHITVAYAGYDVLLTSDGVVTLTEREASTTTPTGLEASSD